MTGKVESCDGAGPGIRIGDRMLDKYKNWTGWYECKVVSGTQGGKWVVKWDDNDPDDTFNGRWSVGGDKYHGREKDTRLRKPLCDMC